MKLRPGSRGQCLGNPESYQKLGPKQKLRKEVPIESGVLQSRAGKKGQEGKQPSAFWGREPEVTHSYCGKKTVEGRSESERMPI